jgi:hypothetical protein
VADKKKPPEGGIFLEAEKITSSLQQVQRQGQQQVRQRQQQVRQVQQQGLQQQVRVLLFCHKRPRQRPTTLPRGVIFSWGYSFNRDKNVLRDAKCQNEFKHVTEPMDSIPSTQPLIIG